MFPALYIFVAMVVIGVILYIHDRLTNKSGEREEGRGESGEKGELPKSHDDCSDECCGANDVCPSEMMLKHFNEPAEYYEDEELDDFKGRDANEYNDDELEQWRDVLYSLKHDELLSWERSIKKRGLQLPNVIKEELISLYNAK